MAIVSTLDGLALAHILDESAVGTTGSGNVTRYANGMTRGSEIPEASTNRIVSFSGVSAMEAVYPTAPAKNLRRELNKFFAGGTLLVYRSWPTVMTRWTPTNPQGWDIIHHEGTGGEYAWRGQVIGRYNFELKGVAENG